MNYHKATVEQTNVAVTLWRY